jgi:hypothetical protein
MKVAAGLSVSQSLRISLSVIADMTAISDR